MVRELIIDTAGIAGICMLFYGLYTFLPWLAFVVVGCLLIAFAVISGRK